MSQKVMNHIAQEAQLLAEEKWIIDALNKIKAQRNSLQIERLNLESIKTQLKNDKRSGDNREREIRQISGECVSAVNLMQSRGGAVQAAAAGGAGDEASCNRQELDLTVTTPVLSVQTVDPLSAEEDEDEDDEVLLDMNMLMDA